MPRPKRPDFNAPANLLERLPGKPIITTGDKLAALQTMFHRCEIGWRGLHLPIINAIREDIRLSAWRKREQAQRDSAPVRPEAPLRPEQSSEAGGSSIAASPLERKIVLPPHGDLLIRIDMDTFRLIVTHESICALSLTHDQADQFATALAELADDLRQDIAARVWSRDLLATTTE